MYLLPFTLFETIHITTILNLLNTTNYEKSIIYTHLFSSGIFL